MSPPRPDGGYMTVLALLVVVLLSGALALVALSLDIRMREARQDAVTVRLVALNDAVLAETLATLRYRRHFNGVSEKEFGGGVISSRVSAAGPQRVEIVSRAVYAGRTRASRATVALTAGGPVVIAWRRAADPEKR